MAIAIPSDVRALLDAPNYVHLATLRRDGSPRNWVVWVGLEGDRILIGTGTWKAKDMGSHSTRKVVTGSAVTAIDCTSVVVQ
jgi:hypothetical protein